MSCACAGAGAAVGPTLAATCGGGAYMLFMGLLEVFLRSQCDLEDPCGRPKFRTHMDSVYDFVVVGGGSAGSVVAARLSEVPGWRVLLLEAGMDEPTGTQVPSMFLNFLGSSIDWGYHTQREKAACLAEEGQKCYWPRGKVLGGTSVMNGMMYIRGSRKDFDDWAAAGNEGWSYEEVLPYFMKSEDNKQLDAMDAGYHGAGGPLSVSQFPYHPPLSYALLEAAKELGYPTRDLNGLSRSGFAIAQTTHRNGSRLSAARAFLRPAAARPNLHLMLNTTVSRVLINQTTRTAYAVQVRNHIGGTETIYANNEIIISGGTVSSPQILQLSGIGDSEKLRAVGVEPVHHLPCVGQNLHNHVAFFVNFFVNDSNTAPLNWATAMEYLLFRDGLMSGTGISEVTGFIKTKYADPNLDQPDVQYFFGGYLANCAKSGMVGESLGEGEGEGGRRRSVQFIPAVLQPKSRGRIELASSDPFKHPNIYANYFSHPNDIKVLIEGIKFAIKLSKTRALQRYGFELDPTPVKGCEGLRFGGDAYWECAVRQQTGPENHQAGSCKMGPRGDPTAVVDNLLQVQGLDRLRVVDASVMPTVTSGNTNAPTIMIAEKASDLIKMRWLGPNSGPYGSEEEPSAINNGLQGEAATTHWQKWH